MQSHPYGLIAQVLPDHPGHPGVLLQHLPRPHKQTSTEHHPLLQQRVTAEYCVPDKAVQSEKGWKKRQGFTPFRTDLYSDIFTEDLAGKMIISIRCVRVYLCDDGGQASVVETFMVCIWFLVPLPVLQLHLEGFVHPLRHTLLHAHTPAVFIWLMATVNHIDLQHQCFRALRKEEVVNSPERSARICSATAPVPRRRPEAPVPGPASQPPALGRPSCPGFRQRHRHSQQLYKELFSTRIPLLTSQTPNPRCLRGMR